MARKLRIGLGLTALLGLAATAIVYLLSVAYEHRHDPSQKELIELASRLDIAVGRIEDYRQDNGRYPSSLSDARLSENMWFYYVDPASDSCELWISHSHWVSSYNALLYASSGTPRSCWDGLRTIRFNQYYYAIGAQHVNDW